MFTCYILCMFTIKRDGIVLYKLVLNAEVHVHATVYVLLQYICKRTDPELLLLMSIGSMVVAVF